MVYWFVWIAFIVYAVAFAPGASLWNDELLKSLLTGNWTNIDPTVTAVFSFLGIFPLIFTLIIWSEQPNKKLALPFIIASFFAGAFALLPYFAITRSFSSLRDNISHQTLYNRRLIIVMMTLSLGLYFYFWIAGSLTNFQAAFASSQFVSIMAIDFIVLTWLSFSVLASESREKPWIALFPVLGTLFAMWFIDKEDL